MIRYHSFYPWHQGGAYRHLMEEKEFVLPSCVLAVGADALVATRPSKLCSLSTPMTCTARTMSMLILASSNRTTKV